MIDFKNLAYQLEELKLIRLRNEEQVRNKKFNIFTVLRNPHEEVGLHSRFLKELLDPLGAHGKKDIFLKHFLNIVKHKGFHLTKVKAYCEKYKIDILVQNINQAIVIENKIYAGDQPQQLDRYYNTLVDAGYADIQLYYLTLTGAQPSKLSLGNLTEEIKEDNLKLISYKKHIPEFINRCIKECATQPELRETLVQYNNLLKQLTMSSHLDTIKQIQSTLGDLEKMKTAHFLVKNWNHIRWHTEWDFWNELKTQAPKDVILSEHFEYSAQKLNSVIHHKRNRNNRYGLAIELFEEQGDEICLLIERGAETVFYGVRVVHKPEGYINKHTEFLEFLKPFSQSHHPVSKNYAWLAWCVPNSNINFNSFSNSDTLSLADPIKRTKIVKEIWSEVMTYRDKVIKWKN